MYVVNVYEKRHTLKIALLGIVTSGLQKRTARIKREAELRGKMEATLGRNDTGNDKHRPAEPFLRTFLQR